MPSFRKSGPEKSLQISTCSHEAAADNPQGPQIILIPKSENDEGSGDADA
jgi:hypothetical protein